MKARKDSYLRRQVDAVVGELKAHRLDITAAAYRLLCAGAPFDVAVRVIARNTSAYE